jgi:hypothetical protein
MSEITHLKEQFLPHREQPAAITNISCTLFQLNCHQLLTLLLHVLAARCDSSGWAPLAVLVNTDKGTLQLTFGPNDGSPGVRTGRAAYWAPIIVVIRILYDGA